MKLMELFKQIMSGLTLVAFLSLSVSAWGYGDEFNSYRPRWA